MRACRWRDAIFRLRALSFELRGVKSGEASSLAEPCRARTQLFGRSNNDE
jgi:hypothetical protein